MFSFSGRPRLSLGVGIAAYLVGSIFVAAIATHAVWQAGAALLEQLAPADDRASSNGVIARAPGTRGPMSLPASSGPLSVRSDVAMTQLQERWDGRWGGGPYG